VPQINGDIVKNNGMLRMWQDVNINAGSDVVKRVGAGILMQQRDVKNDNIVRFVAGILAHMD
jgi:hypothetical protein